MSFIDDVINVFNQAKDYASGLADGQIAEIKDYMGRFNTFEKKIIDIGKQIDKGSYSAEIINKYAEIKDRQAQLQVTTDKFLEMTNTVQSDFSDAKFSIDYIKSKLPNIQNVLFNVIEFFTRTKSEIDKQEQEIEDIQKLMQGDNPTILKVKNFVKDHWLISGIVGYIAIKKILK